MRKCKRHALLLAASLLILVLLINTGICHSAQTANSDFQAYTGELFRQELSGNTISLHYTLKNPSAYGISDTAISLGTFPTDPLRVCASIENAQALLHTFDRKKLSTKNKLTYDVINDYYRRSLKAAPYILYEEPLAPLTGIQSQLPILLSEYQFYKKTDVENYLKLLEKVPEYFDSLTAFETARAESGFLMSDSAMRTLKEEITSFLGLGSTHYLYTTFNERIEKLHELSSREVRAFKKSNAARLKNYVFPSYRSLLKALKKLKHSKHSEGLSMLPQGKEYYQALVASETGSSRSISELKKLTLSQIKQDLTDLHTCLLAQNHSERSDPTITPSPTSDFYAPQSMILTDANPLAILTDLRKKMHPDFPTPPSTQVQIKYVQKSMEDFLSPAFYMIPAIDNTHSNVIYINGGHLPDDLSLFTTLAHEGYPGHLYQNVFYMSRQPTPIRCLLNYGGYTEGWATYAEMLSYYYAPLSKNTATIMQKNDSALLGLYALADIGIHYEGWSLSDTVTFFDSYGIQDTEAIQKIYELIVADPANYLKYYIGYVEFLELKKYAIKTWGNDFTQKKFHEAVLETGPAPFDLLKKEISHFSPNAKSPEILRSFYNTNAYITTK